MSRDNIDLIVRVTEAVYHRPKPDFDTINALVDPEHVLFSAWTTAFGGPEVKGARGFQNWMRETDGAMPWSGQIDGVIDLGPEMVLLAATLTVEGAASRIEGEIRIWCVHTLRNGKLVRTETYTNPREAIEAAVATLR